MPFQAIDPIHYQRPVTQPCSSRSISAPSSSSSTALTSTREQVEYNDSESTQEDPKEQTPPHQVFGAVDDVGATRRQISGAAVVGGLAAGMVGGPCLAVVGAAVAAHMAQHHEHDLAQVARASGDVVSNVGHAVLQNDTVTRTVRECSQRASASCAGMKRISLRDSAAQFSSAANNETMKQALLECSKRANKVKERLSIRGNSNKTNGDPMDGDNDNQHISAQGGDLLLEDCNEFELSEDQQDASEKDNNKDGRKVVYDANERLFVVMD